MKKQSLLIFALFLACFMGVSQAQVTVAPYVSPNVQFFDNTGAACAGCTVSFFAAGTTTPQATYSDSAGTVPNANPLTLDSAGRGTIFLTSAAYKIVLKDAAGNTLTTTDNVTWNNLATSLTQLTVNGQVQVIPSTAATSGANQSGPNVKWCGNAWNGSSSIADCWTWVDTLGTGSNPTSTLTLSHSGSSGTPSVNLGNFALTTGPLNGVSYITAAQLQAGSTWINTPCNGTTPGVAFLPVGSTTGVAVFSVPSNCSIRCPSPLGCSITAAANYGTNFVTSSGTSNVAIEGISIDCNKANQSGTGHCVHATGVTAFYLRNSVVQNSKANAVWVDGTGNATIYIEGNRVQHTTGGNGILIGNTPASQGGADASATDIHINRNEIHDINGTSDGIFTIGEVSSTGYGIVAGEITANVIDTIADTGIEVGVGSKQISVTGNAVDVIVSTAGAVGISTRSASNIAIANNSVLCHGGTAQFGIFSWHNTAAVADPPSNQFIGIAGNTVTGCNPNAGADIDANSGDNITVAGNKTDGTTASYIYGGSVTNLTHFANDDGLFGSNNGLDYTFDPGASHFVHFARAVGVAVGGSNTPAAGELIHVLGTGSSDSIVTEANADASQGFTMFNTAQKWNMAVRSDLTEAWALRDRTNSIDVLKIAPSTGAITQFGKTTTYNNRATSSNGIASTYGADDKTAQSANIGAVTLLTGGASTSGHYRINGIIACTATDASGATVVLTTNWTQDGVSRSSSTSSLGVNATTNQQPFSLPIFVDASTNVTYSTTVTGTPTTGRYSVHIWLTQE